jgi:hypothetical protein
MRLLPLPPLSLQYIVQKRRVHGLEPSAAQMGSVIQHAKYTALIPLVL